jgi:protein-S-isoprenylcysteine O-methyltransferase Ste14
VRIRFASLDLDWFERLFVLTLYVWLVAGVLRAFLSHGGIVNLLLLPCEGMVVAFMLCRRRANVISTDLGEWVWAMVATCAPMLARPTDHAALLPASVGALLLILGIIVQTSAKVTLGRSIGCVPAHRGLRLAGPYRLVRHPMYAGYLVSHIAFLALNPSLWNALVYGLCYALQIPRLVAEEQLLSRDPQYRSYQDSVRFRLIPGVF